MDTSSVTQGEIEALSSDLAREDDLGAVLRAHICIEAQLVRYIETRAFAPQHLGRLQLEYDQYVTMALVLGISPAWISVLRALGRLRNSFAHKLDATLDDNAVNGLYEALPIDGKAQVQESYGRMRSDTDESKLPDRFGLAGPKERFQVVALVVWTRLVTSVVQASAQHGA